MVAHRLMGQVDVGLHSLKTHRSADAALPSSLHEAGFNLNGP